MAGDAVDARGTAHTIERVGSRQVIIDTSAILAILFGEPDAARYEEAIAMALAACSYPGSKVAALLRTASDLFLSNSRENWNRGCHLFTATGKPDVPGNQASIELGINPGVALRPRVPGKADCRPPRTGGASEIEHIPLARARVAERLGDCSSGRMRLAPHSSVLN